MAVAEVDEDEGAVLEGLATVKTCPTNEVVIPDAVAVLMSVMASPPTEVTTTFGTPLDAVTPHVRTHTENQHTEQKDKKKTH